MDQVVNPPKAESDTSIEAALGLDRKGMIRKRRRGWLYALLALAVVAVVIGVYRWNAAAPPRIEYTTAPATVADLTVQVSATGTLQPLTQVDISSELSGIVRSVAVSENQQVKKGDVLATLDTAKLEVQIERATASAKAAAAAVEDAKVTLQENEKAVVRASALTKRGMATDQSLEAATATRDRSKAALDSAEANLAIAEADLKAQQTDLAKSTIYAPIDGIVLTRSVDPGQTVASSLQAPVLFVIAADLRNMELQAAVDEADIGQVKPGQHARFTVDAFPDRPFDAEIRDISYASVTTDGVVTYNARLEVDNGGRLLRPGMTATVAVVTRQAKGVLTVPATAFRYRPAEQAARGWSLRDLFTGRMGRPNRQREATKTPTDGSRTIYVLENGRPHAVNVRIGSTDGELTEITSGLDQGAEVITGSQQRS
ncbi:MULTISPECIES: efflux RND transporter periplasmic adaptor subunit [unclassified Mesorhizobium]|uniref:efflux RND transporter periplasmic adaptor subunit n=1 Tax=unclassified Mesorhizobium TaxID=325217 RepID=UPI000F759A05|nr:MULTISPECIES: efflux RND transporter periplasmic adaptor subunit [unclassified Mesorhizobium]AZO23032.1 efflux RND transporter periplasmic adaptor subunit [Mesorhizobium sp. M1E.F.Ca.ET.045.02.1.1]RUW22573.1 efflux RND transporter periplasmic adaptor subunit [Mesorhizobium sp. M1E.F.Ca.ET.041.01.1.1]RUW75930.1 efflux RND transporter periplasmic adaptor subunit [Mesorhizobium sp. M1E.F.Ca.ET.063.01.1.1]RWD89151.1 MAG: efflux RND transporter periplasmic adaptor subunit [Mesorhizobium sp.]RWD8